jgi:tetratricopeptide (TPR) repeat protein
MQTLHEILSSSMRRWTTAAAAALALAACNTSGTTRPEPVEIRDESGLSIIDQVHVSGGVRSDFESAVRMLEEEHYEAGIALLLEVTEEAPDVTTPHIDLAMAYRRVDDLDRAEASIERALELNPRHPVALNESGIIYRRTGRFEKARKSYEKALGVYPEFHFARKNLAILCDVYLENLDCAIQHYELYTRAVPDDEAAAIWITDLRSRAGR